MVNYPLFLSLYSMFLNVILFYSIVAVLHWRQQIPRSSFATPLIFPLLMGIFDSLQSLLGFLSDEKVEGDLQQLLVQLTVPLTMIFSFVFLRRKFSMMQLFGAFLIILAITIDVMPAILDPSQYLDSPFSWSLIYASSCIPFALSNVVKEFVLQPKKAPTKDRDNRQKQLRLQLSRGIEAPDFDDDHSLDSSDESISMIPTFNDELSTNKRVESRSEQVRDLLGEDLIPNHLPPVFSSVNGKMSESFDQKSQWSWKQEPMSIFYLLATDTTFTLYMTLLFSPINLVPWLGSASSFSDLYYSFMQGLRCAAGINTYPNDQCHGVWQLLLMYYLFNVAINLLLIYLTKTDSASFMILAMSLTVPISNVCFSFHWVMGPNTVSISVYDIIAVFVILAGLLLYHFSPPENNRVTRLLWKSMHCISVLRESSISLEDAEEKNASEIAEENRTMIVEDGEFPAES